MNRTKSLCDMLVDEGHRPRIDKDGDILFKVDGHRFILYRDSTDDAYVRLALGFLIEPGTSNDRALGIANAMNAQYKAVKSSVRGQAKGVTFSIEACYVKAKHLAPFLPRDVGSLIAVSEDFFRKLRSNKAID